MQPNEYGTENLAAIFWESNRDYLRRLLISMSRDIDLAEDLLQETYLAAQAGMDGYRGGNSRAWLTAIAKNVFYSHLRKRSVRMEICADIDLDEDVACENGSHEHLVRLQLREAVASLSSIYRLPFLMKHYGGFTFDEIGERLGCPTGTARRRVWTAIRKLKAALAEIGEETTTVKCRNLRGTRLLDYLYGGLPEKQVKAIEAHLEQCPACREQVRGLRELIAGIDNMEADDRTIRIVDLDAKGVPTDYSWWSMTNAFGQTMDINWWTVNKDSCVDCILLQGQEVPIRVLPSSSAQYRYEGDLPRPVEPGGRVDSFFVYHPTRQDSFAVKLPDGTWRYSYRTTPNSSREWDFVMALRLPRGAELIEADPEPTEVRANAACTVIWRTHLTSFEEQPRDWQFESTVHYRLDTGSAEQEKHEPECRKSQFTWAPEIAFRVPDLPWTGCGEEALHIFREIKKQELTSSSMWMKLGLSLYDGHYYTEALEAFARMSEPPTKYVLWERFISLVWQGQIRDLLEERDKAINFYQEALKIDTGDWTMRHDQYGLYIDRKWVEGLLITPFIRSDA